MADLFSRLVVCMKGKKCFVSCFVSFFVQFSQCFLLQLKLSKADTLGKRKRWMELAADGNVRVQSFNGT